MNNCFVVLRQQVAQRWLLCYKERVSLPLLFLSDYAKFALSEKTKEAKSKISFPPICVIMTLCVRKSIYHPPLLYN